MSTTPINPCRLLSRSLKLKESTLENFLSHLTQRQRQWLQFALPFYETRALVVLDMPSMAFSQASAD
jgi:hypothetical protein